MDGAVATHPGIRALYKTELGSEIPLVDPHENRDRDIVQYLGEGLGDINVRWQDTYIS